LGLECFFVEPSANFQTVSADFTNHPYKIFPLGDNALTIELGNEISPALNDKAVKISQYFEKNLFEGFIESVPAYSSVSIFYDVFKVRKAFPDFSTAFQKVKNLAEKALRNLAETAAASPLLIEIPVDFRRQFALDLDFVASKANLTANEVIEIFTGRTYRVFMVGFLPGFAYMGEVDERIAAARKESPRLVVPKGSVGIAGKQTGIYPFDSPGGWRIIGKTDFELFTPQAENPCALKAGNSIKFYASNR
jgi:inhibitor of KinA